MDITKVAKVSEIMLNNFKRDNVKHLVNDNIHETLPQDGDWKTVVYKCKLKNGMAT